MGHYDYRHIYEYLEGELPPGEKKLLETHILVCDKCREKFDKAKKLFVLLKVEEEEPPLSLTELVMEKIDSKRIWANLLAVVFSLLIASLILPLFLGYSTALRLYIKEAIFIRNLFRGVMKVALLLPKIGSSIFSPSSFYFALGLIILSAIIGYFLLRKPLWRRR